MFNWEREKRSSEMHRASAQPFVWHVNITHDMAVCTAQTLKQDDAAHFGRSCVRPPLAGLSKHHNPIRVRPLGVVLHA
jgi:hypothetical protein